MTHSRYGKLYLHLNHNIMQTKLQHMNLKQEVDRIFSSFQIFVCVHLPSNYTSNISKYNYTSNISKYN